MSKKATTKSLYTAVNKIVKIQGTQYDRKRKLTDAQIEMLRILRRHGYTYKELAEQFGVSITTVAYNTNEDYKKYINEVRKNYAFNSYTTPEKLQERAMYKLKLLQDGLIK